jgi:hypothetical protein
VLSLLALTVPFNVADVEFTELAALVVAVGSATASVVTVTVNATNSMRLAVAPLKRPTIDTSIGYCPPNPARNQFPQSYSVQFEGYSQQLDNF